MVNNEGHTAKIDGLCFILVQRLVFEWLYTPVYIVYFLQYASAEQEEEGRKRYEAQKMERLETKARIEEVMPSPPNPGNIHMLRVWSCFSCYKFLIMMKTWVEILPFLPYGVC